jgi:hypothetical protein
MRLLAVAAIAVAIAVCVAVVVLAIREFIRWRRRYLEQHSRWVDVLVTTSDSTYVFVQRAAETWTGRTVLEQQLIGIVGHNNPEWDTRVNDLRMRAWDRAIQLNQPSLTE